MLFLDNLTIILLHYQLLTASISESSVENIVCNCISFVSIQTRDTLQIKAHVLSRKF